jgi:hypothetical protein
MKDPDREYWRGFIHGALITCGICIVVLLVMAY